MSNDAQAWYDVLGKFKAKFMEFLNTRNELLQKWPVVKDNPELLAEWTKLKNRSDTIYKVAMEINAQITKGKTWLASTFGIQLSGLGVLPAIPIAIGVVGIAGAVSTITYFIADVVQFNGKVGLYEKLVSQGKSATEAADIVAQMASSGGISTALQSASGVLKNALPILLIGAAIYFLPKMKGR